jgi:hypothetical protein
LTALAMVTTSVLGRIVANLLMGLSSTPIPMRLFSNEQAALMWLRGVENATSKRSSVSTHPAP